MGTGKLDFSKWTFAELNLLALITVFKCRNWLQFENFVQEEFVENPH